MMDGQWHVNGYFDSTKLTGLYEAAQRRESTRLFAAAPCAEKWAGPVPHRYFGTPNR